MGMGFSKMKKQAKLMQEKMIQMQKELKEKKIEGIAANGLVKITINGDKELEKITIDPQCVDKNDVEGLEDLIVVAFKDAFSKIEDDGSSDLNSLMPF